MTPDAAPTPISYDCKFDHCVSDDQPMVQWPGRYRRDPLEATLDPTVLIVRNMRTIAKYSNESGFSCVIKSKTECSKELHAWIEDRLAEHNTKEGE